MKVLLATDGSACSVVAVDQVARRPWPEDTQIKILAVAETHAPLTGNPSVSASYFDEVDKVARDLAEDAVRNATITLHNVKPDLAVSAEILDGSPKRVIVEEAEKWGADLIVVGSHGYRSWERMLLGSVSQAVAMHAECSVEIVRGKREMPQSVKAS